MSKSEGKRVLSNFLYNLLYQIVKMILPLITIPYVSRVLGAENLGIFNYVFSVAIYFEMIAYLGFDNHGSRLIAQKKNDLEGLNKAFTGAYCFQLISCIIAIVLYIAFMTFFCEHYRLVAWIQIIYISAEIFNINWLYFGLENFKKTALINTLVRIAAFAAVLIFVKDRSDLPVYTVICAASPLVSTLLLWPGTCRHVRFVKVNAKDIWDYGKGAIVLFFPVLVINIYRTMDKIMLRTMCTYDELGLYAAAFKIVSVLSVLQACFSLYWTPVAYRWYEQKKSEDSFTVCRAHSFCKHHRHLRLTGCLRGADLGRGRYSRPF